MCSVHTLYDPMFTIQRWYVHEPSKYSIYTTRYIAKFDACRVGATVVVLTEGLQEKSILFVLFNVLFHASKQLSTKGS